MAKTVEEVKRQPKVAMRSIQTTMKYGEGEYVVWLNIMPDGSLLVVPEVTTDAIKQIELRDVGFLFSTIDTQAIRLSSDSEIPFLEPGYDDVTGTPDTIDEISSVDIDVPPQIEDGILVHRNFIR